MYATYFEFFGPAIITLDIISPDMVLLRVSRIDSYCQASLKEHVLI